MATTRTVLLHGNSLAVSSIAANLACQPNMALHRLDPSVPDLARQVELLNPDVLIFDLAVAPPANAVDLLREHPHLLLIGVDATNARMLVVCGRRSQAMTIDDLTRVIEAHGVLEGETHPQPDPKGDQNE